jgi:hypothetical protein
VTIAVQHVAIRNITKLINHCIVLSVGVVSKFVIVLGGCIRAD